MWCKLLFYNAFLPFLVAFAKYILHFNANLTHGYAFGVIPRADARACVLPYSKRTFFC